MPSAEQGHELEGPLVDAGSIPVARWSLWGRPHEQATLLGALGSGFLLKRARAGATRQCR